MSEFAAAQRVRGFGTTIFAEMTMLALQQGAINLGQGFPDFAGPDWVKQAAAEAISADLNQYAPGTGLPRLRNAIAAHWAYSGRRELDPTTEVTITAGATEALFAATLALVNPGDEVICFEPYYDAYVPNITMAGGIPRYVRLHPPRPTESVTSDGVQHSSWWFDPEELAAAFTPRTRMIMLNTPHNPTGKVFSPAELAQIAALCRQHDVIAVCDEVYDQIIFDAAVHVPLATLPGMWERTLTVNSTGKTFSLTGWKIGYAVGPVHLTQALRQAHQWITFAVATPLQEATAVALELAAHNGYYDELRNAYRERRDRLEQTLRAAGLPPLPVQGSYFIMADIRGTAFTDDVAFCRWLTREIGVAAIPPSAFYAERNGMTNPRGALPLLARFCFAKRLETLDAAAARLERLRQHELSA